MASVEVESAKIDVKFSEVYDTSPPLPRPLKTRMELKYITKEGLLEEALSVAPLNPGEEKLLEDLGLHESRSLPTDAFIKRHIKRNLIYERKAQEFAIVHQELFEWYNKFIAVIDTIQTGCSFALTIMMYVPLEEARTFVDNCVAVATLALGCLKSFVVISGFEKRAAQHRNASRGFGEVSEQVGSFLALLFDMERRDAKAAKAAAKSNDPEPPAAGAEASGPKPSVAASHAKPSDPTSSAASAGARHPEVSAASAGASDPQASDADARAKEAAAALAKFGNLQPGKVLDMIKAKAATAAPSGAGAGHAEEANADEAPSEVIKRMRLLYRKALEFRVAHALYESFYWRADKLTSFLHLVLSSVTSGVLFLQEPMEEAGLPAETIALVLTTTLTGLNAAIGAMQLPKHVVTHMSARLAFASLQRSFATTLMIDRPEDISKRFQEYAAQWNETLANTFAFTPANLQAIRDETDWKTPLLPLITPPILSTRELKAALKAKADKMKAAAEAKGMGMASDALQGATDAAKAKAGTVMAAAEAQHEAKTGKGMGMASDALQGAVDATGAAKAEAGNAVAGAEAQREAVALSAVQGVAEVSTFPARGVKVSV